MLNKTIIKSLHKASDLDINIVFNKNLYYIARLLSFIQKEFPLFLDTKISRKSGICGYHTILSRVINSDIFIKYEAIPYSCNRMLINKYSNLSISLDKGRNWRQFRVDDLNYVLKEFDNFCKMRSTQYKLDVSSQFNKIIQQLRYYYFIDCITKSTKRTLSSKFRSENLLGLLFINDKKIFSYCLADVFGVNNGHLDHPTPYPYTTSYRRILSGEDPFISFLSYLNYFYKFNDEKLASYLTNKDILKNRLNSKLINFVSFVEISKTKFVQKDWFSLKKLTLLIQGFDKSGSNKMSDFLIPVHGAEILAFEESTKKKFTDLINLSLYNKLIYPCLPTSSGRSVFLPLKDENGVHWVSLKTSWPDIIKTSLNRSLSSSRIEWFKVCNEIYKKAQFKSFVYLYEQHFSPILISREQEKYLTFIRRDLYLDHLKKNQYVLPMVALINPFSPFPVKYNLLITLMEQSLKGKEFLKKIIGAVTDVVIEQLLNNGIYHGLHLQNCNLLVELTTSGQLIPKKVVARDGDVRICSDYIDLFDCNIQSLIDSLSQKKGKINSKDSFYQYLFHNIINENFGNIEMCLLQGNMIDSSSFWKLVKQCFDQSIKKEIKKIQQQGKYQFNIHGRIIKDFHQHIFFDSGYAANFFQMEFLKREEAFVQVRNPFIKNTKEVHHYEKT